MSECKDQSCSWAIVLLIYADYTNDNSVKTSDDKIKVQLNQLLEDLYRCRIKKGVRVFMVLNSIQYIKEEGSDKLMDETLVSEVCHDVPCNRMDTFKRIDNLKHPGIGKLQLDKNLIEIFQLIKERSNPEHIFLITWDHGSVFGIFKDLKDEVNTESSNNPLFTLRRIENNEANQVAMPAFNRFLEQAGIPVERNSFSNDPSNEAIFELGNTKFILPDNKVGNLGQRYFSEKNASSNRVPGPWRTDMNFSVVIRENKTWLSLSETTTTTEGVSMEIFREIEQVAEVQDILTNEELSDAIEYGFERKVDVLLMMNCWMSNVHTAHALQRWVNYLAAPQTSIDYPGYDYEKLINHTESNTTALQILETCKLTLERPDAQKYGQKQVSQISLWSVPFLNLEEYQSNKVSQCISEIAGLALLLLKDRVCEFLLKSARRHCFLFSEVGGTEYNMIDLYQWLISVNHIREVETLELDAQISYKVLSRKIDELSEYHYSNKPLAFRGENVYADTRCHGKVTSIESSGLSIYFPEKSSAPKNTWLRKTLENSSFMRDYPNWGLLLNGWLH